jgi:hypothetical protein
VLLRGVGFLRVSMAVMRNSGVDENRSTIDNCGRNRKLVEFMAFPKGNSDATSGLLYRSVV